MPKGEGSDLCHSSQLLLPTVAPVYNKDVSAWIHHCVGSRLMPDDKDKEVAVDGANGDPTTTPPVALDSMTPSSAEVDLQPDLPSLPYSLHEHKKNICLVWSLFALDSAILPIVLFYVLWFASSLQPAYIFAVTTGVFGLISGIEWATRSWLLFKREILRPLGANDTRWVGLFQF